MEKKDFSFIENMKPQGALVMGLIAGVIIGVVIMVAVAGGGGIKKVEDQIKKDVATTTDQVVVSDDKPVVIPESQTNKPKVELFIMTYCPYGLQMQKAYLPVMKLLGGKADMDIKFVSYIMHGEREIVENNTQYCIQKEQADKYVSYAECFAATGNAASCLKLAKVDEAKLASCVLVTDKTFKITELFNNKNTWLSGNYPLYNVHKDLNVKYGVQGSPTLVINGKQVNVNRTAEAVKTAVCDTFEVKPAECNTVLSIQSLQAGFGAAAGASQDATCN